MSPHFLLCILFLLFHTQNSSESTRNTLSALDQEVMKVQQELQFVSDPCGLLTIWLARARLEMVQKLNEARLEFNQKLDRARLEFDQKLDGARRENENLKRDKTELQNDLTKVRSPLIARSYIDDYEDTMDSEFNFPNKQDMIKQINDLKNRNKFLITIPYDTDPNNEKESRRTLNSIKPYGNIHEIKWLYYLLFSKTEFAWKIRNLLMKNNIPVLNFCNMVGKIHEKTSGKVHGISENITPEELKKGLKLNGIIDNGLESCLDVLLAIKKEEALFKGTLSTLDPSGK